MGHSNRNPAAIVCTAVGELFLVTEPDDESVCTGYFDGKGIRTDRLFVFTFPVAESRSVA
jgi:hypothetical protein